MKNTYEFRLIAENTSNGIIFCVHHVYIEDGVIVGYGEKPVPILGSDVDEITWLLGAIEKALSKPMLWGGDRFPAEVDKSYNCVGCGKSFNSKVAHNCVNGFTKRNLRFEEVYK